VSPGRQQAAKLYRALREHPMPTSALPRGFQFTSLKGWAYPPVYVVDETLRGPDSDQAIIFTVAPREVASAFAARTHPWPSTSVPVKPSRPRALRRGL
jgi:hypothetical protein